MSYNHEIAVGTKVELEHTMDHKLARKIAAKHISENPRYYQFYDANDKQAKEFLITLHKDKRG